MNGFINLYKPAGITSFQAVARVRRLTGEPKVGHAGTLDPEASGILPICLGKGTRCADYFLRFAKTYQAEMIFGASYDTGDVWGKMIAEKDASAVTETELRRVLPEFTGTVMQTPPAYSALKIGGVPAYRLARNGKTPELAPRPVQIYKIELLSFCLPRAVLRVTCGRGTYIRTLCENLAERLGTCGAMSALERQSYGSFTAEHAITPEALSEVLSDTAPQERETLLRARGILLPPDCILQELPAVSLNGRETDDYRHGRPVTARENAEGECRIYAADGALLGTASVRDGFWKGAKYLAD